MKVSRDNWFVRRYWQATYSEPTNLCGMFWTAILGAIEPFVMRVFPFVFGGIATLAAIGLSFALYRSYVNGELWQAAVAVVCLSLFAAVVFGVVALTLKGVGFLGRRLARTESGRVIIEYAKAGKQGICPLIEVVD